MKHLFILAFISISMHSFSQAGKEKVPSYFGIQVRPIFPTQFVGSPTLDLEDSGFVSTLTQRPGFSFGGTVRAGITELIAFETGINYTQRTFHLSSGVPDSNSMFKDTLTFIEYDIPLNGLVYIKLTDEIYMNTSLGATITYKPTNVRLSNSPGGDHRYTHDGLLNSKVGLDLNANVGFEYRTRKSGFFYIGGSIRVPLAPLFILHARYANQGYKVNIFGEVDGSFLAIDFKYFFPNIKNKGKQPLRSPIE